MRPSFSICCFLVTSCVWLFVTLGLKPTRLLCPWNFPGKNTGVGCHFLLKGIFLTQGLNSSLLLGRWILFYWATWEAPSWFTYCYLLLLLLFLPDSHKPEKNWHFTHTKSFKKIFDAHRQEYWIVVSDLFLMDIQSQKIVETTFICLQWDMKMEITG